MSKKKVEAEMADEGEADEADSEEVSSAERKQADFVVDCRHNCYWHSDCMRKAKNHKGNKRRCRNKVKFCNCNGLL